MLPKTPRQRLALRQRLLLGLLLFSVAFTGLLVALRASGLVRPFHVPTQNSMTPAVQPGSYFLMEGITYLLRAPRRGEIVVFRTDGIGELTGGQILYKRVAGEPGDRVRIAEGRLFVNGRQVTLSNAAGEITYRETPREGVTPATNEVTVPPGCYFVLGDNSRNSFDSRHWGSLPRSNILGRVWWHYWPVRRAGAVK